MPGETTPRDIVLVVDDSPGTLGMVTSALEDAGYTVLVATDGQSALRIVERITPDIILMDALMPGMDGFETTRGIKQRLGMTQVPVIFMTGLRDTDSVLKGLGVGGVDYVTKPAAPDEILARIRVHLANARLARSAHAALDTTGRFLLAAGQDGNLLWLTPQAERLLLADPRGESVTLPSDVSSWLRDRIGGVTTVDRLATAGPDPSRQLEFSFIGKAGLGEFLVRVVERSVETDDVRLRNALGVTAREAEVLLWLSHGKQNRDIAEILGMSPRTVNKHLEQVYAKLGVENRASAAAIALGVLRGGG